MREVDGWTHPHCRILRNKRFNQANVAVSDLSQKFPVVVHPWSGTRLDLQEYWDTCSEAGPANRAATAFEEAQPALEVLAVDGGKLVLLGTLFFL